MRTKLLSALLLASTALTGVASANPIVRDHRYQQPRVTVTRPQPRQPQRYDRDRDQDRDGDRDVRWSNAYSSVYRPAPGATWSGGVQVTAHPTWLPQVNYGYQVDADGDEVTPYTYGNDPYVEGVARGEWSTLNPCIDVTGRGSTREALGMQPLQSLELQATRGGAYVYAVAFIFKDGSQRAFLVNRDLDSREPTMRLDLGSQGLQGVEAVVLETNGTASIRMLGA